MVCIHIYKMHIKFDYNEYCIRGSVQFGIEFTMLREYKLFGCEIIALDGHLHVFGKRCDILLIHLHTPCFQQKYSKIIIIHY